MLSIHFAIPPSTPHRRTELHMAVVLNELVTPRKLKVAFLAFALFAAMC